MEKEIYYEIYDEQDKLLNSFNDSGEALNWTYKQSNLCSKKFFIKEVIITTSPMYTIQLGKSI